MSKSKALAEARKRWGKPVRRAHGIVDRELRDALRWFIENACSCGHESLLHDPACILCANRPKVCLAYVRAGEAPKVEPIRREGPEK